METLITSSLPPCVAVYGFGQFGFAMTKIFNQKYPQIPVIGYDPVVECVNFLQKTHRHPTFFKNTVLGSAVKATSDIREPLQNANIIFIAVPVQHIRSLLRDISPLIVRDTIILNFSKALENGTNKYVSQIADEELKNCVHKTWFAVLCGGMLAEEVVNNFPVAADVACAQFSIALYISDLLQTSTLKLKPESDIIGVQIGSALKNVISIGAGFFDGLGYGISSKSAFISDAAREVKSIAVALDADAETFSFGSQSFIGDLLTTCYGKSRNRYLGEIIGRGLSVDEALATLEKEGKLSEGYLSAKAFYLISQKMELSTPILDIIYKVLFDNHAPKQAILDFWNVKKNNPVI